MVWKEEYQNEDGLSRENMSCPDFALFLMFTEEREGKKLRPLTNPTHHQNNTHTISHLDFH